MPHNGAVNSSLALAFQLRPPKLQLGVPRILHLLFGAVEEGASGVIRKLAACRTTAVKRSSAAISDAKAFCVRASCSAEQFLVVLRAPGCSVRAAAAAALAVSCTCW